MSEDTPIHRRARFVTFGCKVNQYDTQVIRERAVAAGYEPTDGSADTIVVNTCTVTERGGAQARKAVRRLARENPGARIVVTGCYAESDPDLVADLPNVTAVLGNERKTEIFAGPGTAAAPFIEERVTRFAGQTRAFVKVEDGCHLRCAFCIVPSVRPAVASKRPETVVAEVRDLLDAGHREVVLTGVHLGAYGRPDRDALVRLLERLLADTEVPRLRLSSIEVNEVTPRLLALLAAEPRVAPHLHLPLQSGSAEVLRRMRRRYDPGRFLDTIARAREAVADAALTTDVIAGFPGETEENFEETLAVMRAAGFMKTHVFPFSLRRGTPAAKMDGRVPSREIRRRVGAAEAEGRGLARDFASGLIGRTAGVLFESRRLHGLLTGFSERYVRVFAEGADDLMNRIVPVRLTDLADGGASGEILE
jgi:threonylcarbamoyladenosine tRNA methylthiotransferase MtaB